MPAKCRGISGENTASATALSLQGYINVLTDAGQAQGQLRLATKSFRRCVISLKTPAPPLPGDQHYARPAQRENRFSQNSKFWQIKQLQNREGNIAAKEGLSRRLNHAQNRPLMLAKNINGHALIQVYLAYSLLGNQRKPKPRAKSFFSSAPLFKLDRLYFRKIFWRIGGQNFLISSLVHK